MSSTLITTVLNEQNSISNFLQSYQKQTKKADELVIVDGGSKDKTVEKIQEFIKNSKLNIILLEKKGNRSQGRNFAIKHAKNNIIACSDVGCTLDPHWFERITKPFYKSDVDVVSGFYYPVAKTVFEKCISAYTCVMPDRLDAKTFLPSSRSIAFRKSAWQSVDGYPEDLDTCEDLVFAKKLKQADLNFVLVKNAIVLWPQKKNLKDAFMQFFNYAIGDGQALYIRPSTPFLFLRYLFGVYLVVMLVIYNSPLILLLIVTLLVLYFLWSIDKNYRYVRDSSAFIFLPLLQILSDISVILGMAIGFIKRLL